MFEFSLHTGLGTALLPLLTKKGGGVAGIRCTALLPQRPKVVKFSVHIKLGNPLLFLYAKGGGVLQAYDV